MGTFKLDGRDIAFEPGETILRAAWRAGVEIPHYCWHPGLSVAANCRMCLVDIKSQKPMALPTLRWDAAKGEFVPGTKTKLQPACQVPAADAMVVDTQGPEVQAAQAHVQEFLLLNHPVDCPICDQAGECKLQDYWYAHQARPKRKLTEPVHKPKAVRFGETIVYDAERCVMCTRCIRFCDEVVGDHVLDMRQRGNKNEVVLAPGRALDHKYTLMTEHVCPVGALTSRDFRFKARVWFLRSAPGVCGGCATGCNLHVDFDPRVGEVHRLRPRDNLEVNRYWACDDGMLSYHDRAEGRLLVASMGRAGAREAVPVEHAIAAAADQLRRAVPERVAVVLSAVHSTEDNYALARFGRALGTAHLFLAARAAWEGDKVLRNADHNPNRAGALRAAGGALRPFAELLSDLTAGRFDVVLALGSDCAETGAALDALAAARLIALAWRDSGIAARASLRIPVAHPFECDGSYVNARGVSQGFVRAVSAPPEVAPAWRTLGALGARLGHDLGLGSLKALRSALGGLAPSAAGAEVRA